MLQNLDRTISNKLKYAAVFLLGSLLPKFGVEASENYFETPDKLVIKVNNLFHEELKREFEERRNSREAYFLDSMTEQIILGESYDMTVESQEKFQNLMLNIYTDAIKSTLKRKELYEGLREDIENGLPGFKNDSFLERVLDSGEDEVENTAEENFLGASKVKAGFKPSFKDREIGGTGSLDLEDFNLGGISFKKGKIKGRSREFEAYLEKAVSDELEDVYAKLGFKLRDFDNQETDINFSLTGFVNENCTWVASLGYRNIKKQNIKEKSAEEGVYGGVWLSKRF